MRVNNQHGFIPLIIGIFAVAVIVAVSLVFTLRHEKQPSDITKTTGTLNPTAIASTIPYGQSGYDSSKDPNYHPCAIRPPCLDFKPTACHYPEPREGWCPKESPNPAIATWPVVNGCFYRTVSCPDKPYVTATSGQCSKPVKVCESINSWGKMKSGIESFSFIGAACSDSGLSKGALFTCYDGYVGFIGDGKTCKSSEGWKADAIAACEGHDSDLGFRSAWVQCIPRPACLKDNPPCVNPNNIPYPGWCSASN